MPLQILSRSDPMTPNLAMMDALETCRVTGDTITVSYPFEDYPTTRLANVPVIALDRERQRFQVKRVSDDSGKWLAIRHILSITLQSGVTLRSPEGEAYWKRIQAGRAERADWRAELSHSDRAPDTSKAPSGVHAEVRGNGIKQLGRAGSGRDIELWMAWRKFTIVGSFTVRDAISAKRVCGLVGQSYWDMAQAWLACEFEWPDWIRKDARGGLVKAGTVTDVFRWAQAMSETDLVGLFLAKSWERHQVCKTSEQQATEVEAHKLVSVGLCTAASNAPLDVLLDFAHFRDLRALLKMRGLKAKDRHEALGEVLELVKFEPEAIQAELAAAPSFVGKWCLVPPCNLTWDEWQNFRTWHFAMVDAFCNLFVDG